MQYAHPNLLTGTRAALHCCLLLLFTASVLMAQPKTGLVALARGDSVILIPGMAPAPGEGLNFYRKSGTSFTLLNTAGPVMPITDAGVISEMFGARWDDAAMTLGVSTPEDLVFLLQEDQSAFFFISFLYPEIFKIAGCWFVDKTGMRGGDASYKVEYIGEDKAVKKTVTGSVNQKAGQIPVPAAVAVKAENGLPVISWEYAALSRDVADVTVQFGVYRKSTGGAYTRINSGVIPRNSETEYRYTDEGAENGVAYTYYVTAVDITGAESQPSVAVEAFIPDKTAPSVPEEVTADSVSGAIGISWRMNLEPDAAGYLVYRSIKPDRDFVKLTNSLLPTDKTFFYDSTITYGIQYFYAITCSDTKGNESQRSNPLAILYEDVIPPAPPAELRYMARGNTMVFSWQASSSADVAGYHFYRGDSKEVLPRITAEPLTAIAYTDSGYAGNGFTPGKRYTFAVSAIDRARNESPKVYLEDIILPDTVAPAPPTGLLTENREGVCVSISSGGSTSADAENYTLYKGKPGSAAQVLATYTSTPFQYSDSAVVKGETYYYYAVAKDSAGNVSRHGKTDTVLVRDFTPPPSPRTITAKSVTGGILISWEAAFDYDLAGYAVYRAPVPNGSYSKIATVPAATVSYTDTAGSSGAYYRVKAVDTSGNESTRGAYATVK